MMRRQQQSQRGADRERLERERLAGYVRPQSAPGRPQPPQMRHQHIPMPPSQAAQQQPAAQRSTALGAAQSSSQAADALGQVLLRKVHEKVQEDTEQVRGLVDTLSLRLGALENSAKSLELAVASLREEFSGIAQVAGGSVAKKTEDMELSVQKLEKSFVEFSTRLTREVQEADRRQGVLRQELLALCSTGKDSRQMASEAYARSIVVPCRVISDEGIELQGEGLPHVRVPAGASLPLRFPMSQKGDDVTMLLTHVTENGDVQEYAVPVQRSGVRTVAFLAEQPFSAS